MSSLQGGTPRREHNARARALYESTVRIVALLALESRLAQMFSPVETPALRHSLLRCRSSIASARGVLLLPRAPACRFACRRARAAAERAAAASIEGLSEGLRHVGWQRVGSEDVPLACGVASPPCAQAIPARTALGAPRRSGCAGSRDAPTLDCRVATRVSEYGSVAVVMNAHYLVRKQCARERVGSRLKRFSPLLAHKTLSCARESTIRTTLKRRM